MLSKFLKERTGNIFIQLFRYFISGGVALAVDFSLLYILTEKFDFNYLFSARFGFTIGLIITYLFSIFWVFDNRRFKNKFIETAIFFSIGIVGFILTSFFMKFFTEKIGMYYMLSKVFTTIIVFLWNFMMKKLTLFPKAGNKN